MTVIFAQAIANSKNSSNKCVTSAKSFCSAGSAIKLYKDRCSGSNLIGKLRTNLQQVCTDKLNLSLATQHHN